MKRTASASVVCAVVALALAPSSAGKGPHAIVEPGPRGIDPGERWLMTLTLVELDGREPGRPRMILRRGTDRLVVSPTEGQVLGKGRYELSVVFPRAGVWSYTVLDAGRRFEFPPVAVARGGAERDTTPYAAFAEGSPADRQGGGGPILDDAGPPAGGEPLPPEVVVPAGKSAGSGVPLWIPAAGLALAGAGTLTLARRRRR